MAKYWLVQVDFEYLVGVTNQYTTLKTKAGRLRNKDRADMEEYLERAGITSVDFVPTTYKPTGTEFIDPMIWWWVNRPRD
jgi:hypothetical protein